jgi:putative transcriptional regulator
MQNAGMEKFESRVREIRQEQGLTQRALADELKVSRQTIHSLERGEKEPGVLLAMALGALLGVAVEQLFKRKEMVS